MRAGTRELLTPLLTTAIAVGAPWAAGRVVVLAEGARLTQAGYPVGEPLPLWERIPVALSHWALRYAPFLFLTAVLESLAHRHIHRGVRVGSIQRSETAAILVTTAQSCAATCFVVWVVAFASALVTPAVDRVAAVVIAVGAFMVLTPAATMARFVTRRKPAP